MGTQVQQKLLEVNSLSVDYESARGAVHAVRDVSFTLHRGEILGLAGESGCGKSTLAYGIGRLLRPPAVVAGGEVIYYPRVAQERENGNGRTTTLFGMHDLPEKGDGVDVLKLTPRQLRSFRWNELSIVFQSAMNSLNPVITVGSQIIDVLQKHRPGKSSREYKRRAAELFDMVGISADRLSSYPHELSGGMRQRAVIAIALALHPELIIMDEPTTALDVVVQRGILELVKNLCREFNTALIFITHDLSLLLELSDRIAIMYAGKMIEKATSRDIRRHPRHPYSYGLLNAFPTLHGPRRRMTGIPGSPPDLRDIPPGCSFNPRCPLVFGACHEITPQLQPALESNQEQLAACHLYDSRHRSEVPTTEQIAASYSTAVEGSSR